MTQTPDEGTDKPTEETELNLGSTEDQSEADTGINLDFADFSADDSTSGAELNLGAARADGRRSGLRRRRILGLRLSVGLGRAVILRLLLLLTGESLTLGLFGGLLGGGEGLTAGLLLRLSLGLSGRRGAGIDSGGCGDEFLTQAHGGLAGGEDARLSGLRRRGGRGDLLDGRRRERGGRRDGGTEADRRRRGDLSRGGGRGRRRRSRESGGVADQFDDAGGGGLNRARTRRGRQSGRAFADDVGAWVGGGRRLSDLHGRGGRAAEARRARRSAQGRGGGHGRRGAARGSRGGGRGVGRAALSLKRGGQGGAARAGRGGSQRDGHRAYARGQDPRR